MTIASGSTILADDVNGAFRPALATLQVANSLNPHVYWFNVQFNNIKIHSNQGEKTRLFVSPDNYILDEVRISTTNVTSPVTASVDSAYMLRPVQISSSGNNTGSIDSLSSYFDLTGSTPYQTILRGNSYTITMNTSMEGTSRNAAIVSLGFRTFRRRE